MTKRRVDRVEVLPNGQASERAVAELRRAEAATAAALPKVIRRPQPYLPFPVDALPEPLQSYVAEKAAAVGCDVAFVALPAIAVATSMIGNTRTIQLKPGWAEPAIVWTAVIADSGTLKTPAHNGAICPLYGMQKRLLERHHHDSAAYDQAMEQWAIAAKRVKDQGGEPPPKLDKPKRQRVLVSDITIETLAEVLQDNERGILLARDELAGWMGSFTRYKGKSGGTDLQLWLQAYNAVAWAVDRKTGDRRSLFVERASVSVTGGIQPGILARMLTSDHLEAGWMARLLMAMPPKRSKEWSEQYVSPDTEARYSTLLQSLYELDFATDQGTRTPYVVKLTADAHDAWVDFYQEWAAAQAAVHDELAACFSKLEGYAARLALLHHVVSQVGLGCSDQCEISRSSIAAGVVLVRWFAYEAQRVYAMLAEDTDARDTRRLVEFIRSRGGTISARQLRRSSPSRYPAASTAEADLADLAVKGLGEWIDVAPGAKGGRPTRVLRLLSYVVDETDETDETPETDGTAADHPDPSS